MVNKQVIGKERVGRAWGGEKAPIPGGPGAGRALYRREDEPVWGTLSQGALWSHTVLRKVFTCIHHAGARHSQGPRGHVGEARPSAPQMVTPGPGVGLLCRSVQCGLLFTDTKTGVAHPKAKPGQPRQPPLP